MAYPHILWLAGAKGPQGPYGGSRSCVALPNKVARWRSKLTLAALCQSRQGKPVEVLLIDRVHSEHSQGPGERARIQHSHQTLRVY